MNRNDFSERLQALLQRQEELLNRVNEPQNWSECNGILRRYRNPVLTREHVPLAWRYDFNPATNPQLLERIGANAVLNAGAIKWQGKYLLCCRVEGVDRKSYFAIAESPTGTDQFRFWELPVDLPETDDPATNVYDMRLTAHEDGYIYGIFCAERHDPSKPVDLSAAVATAGIVRTKDLLEWERLPDLVSPGQQRNVVLHPEFVEGKYALYTRPQDGFIDTGSGGGIGWALVEDMRKAVIKEQRIINTRAYHTIKEVKNGEGPAPIKTPQGWLHLAHGVRGCAAGLRYVLYAYVTALDEPWRLLAEPAGYLLAPLGWERVGDVSNVVFSNGWIADETGRILLYYAASDTRLHVAETSVERLLDYCFNTLADGGATQASASAVRALAYRNRSFFQG